MSGLYERIEQTAQAIRRRIDPRRPSVGLILGSGLGAYADELDDAVALPYRDIPNFPVSSIDGHVGQLIVGTRRGVTCAAMQGRVHYYEGYSAAEITFPVRVLIALGARTLIVTNAAGGLRDEPGTLMVIRDHINLMPEHPLRGENDERLGPRFPDMTQAYARELRELARAAGKRIGVELSEGVYLGSSGPSYETPAEITMHKKLGADAVGMSTVPEVIVANHMGARVLGISCITNLAAGMSDQPLSHEEVKETAERVRGTFQALLDEILSDLKQ
jgi:purine-nucleoside phosphorylase